jgi:hypothetical protein
MGIANFNYGIASFGVPVFGSMGVGNVYMVCQTADTDVFTQFTKRYGKNRFSDGTWMLNPFIGTGAIAATTNGIQTALDSCVTNRNDYVVVAPSDTNYGLDAVLTMSKKAVHLVCPAGMGRDFPVGNSARIKQLTGANAVIAITNQAVEVAGFYLKNYTALSTITLSTLALSPNIHTNMFNLVWSGAQAPAIAGTLAGGAWGSIDHNWLISESGTSATCAVVIDIIAQATGARVCHNEMTIGDSNTATIGISNQAVKGHTDFNIFSESGGATVGTIAACISVPTYEAAIGNRGAVATGHMFAGGTANRSFCDNRDAQAGGATPVET